MSESLDNQRVEEDGFPSITSIHPWLVCFTASLFFFYEFIQLNMFNAIDEGLIHSFSINAAQLGWLGSSTLIANILFLFPAGILLDRYSTRNLIILNLLLCVLGTYGFSLVQSYEWAWVFRFISGIGSAFCFLSSIRLASRWFPARHLALVTGLIVTMAMLGGLLAQTPLAMLVQSVGWRLAIRFDSILGILFIALIALFVRDFPPGHVEIQSEQQSTSLGVLASLRQVIVKPQNSLAGLYACVMNIPVIAIGAIWGSPYLQSVFRLSPTEASMVTSTVFIGTIIGSPTMGWLSDLFRQRRLVMLAGATISLLIAMHIWRGHSPDFPGLSLSFLFLGFFSSAQVLAYPIVAESNPLELTATAVSVAAFIVQGGGAWLQQAFGWLLVRHWHGHFQAGIPFYSPSNYQYAAIMLPLGFVAAVLVALVIREPHQSD